MDNAELQVENGQYTRIVNKIIDELVKAPLLGAEYAVCLFVIRKTYGFQKKDDEISLTQFQEATGRSRVTIVKALKKLKLVKVLILVNKGNGRIASNRWAFNKYYRTWDISVKVPILVKGRDYTSKLNALKLVKVPIHTKETKETTKEILRVPRKKPSFNPLGAEILKEFESVDMKNKTYYGNTTQRGACDFLIDTYGLEDVLKAIKILPVVNRKKLYIGQVTNPYELKEKWTKIGNAIKQSQDIKKTIIAFT